MMNQEQDDLIRERAYAIWQAEGCPEGRQEQHWLQAAADLSQVRAEAAQDGEAVSTGGAIATPPQSTAERGETSGEKTASSAARSRKVAEPAPAPSKGRRSKGARSQPASRRPGFVRKTSAER